jgi:hypothetical protein
MEKDYSRVDRVIDLGFIKMDSSILNIQLKKTPFSAVLKVLILLSNRLFVISFLSPENTFSWPNFARPLNVDSPIS